MSGQLQEWLDPGAKVIIYALSVPVFPEQGDIRGLDARSLPGNTRGLDARSLQGTQGAWTPDQCRGHEGPGHHVTAGDTRGLDTGPMQQET